MCSRDSGIILMIGILIKMNDERELEKFGRDNK